MATLTAYAPPTLANRPPAATAMPRQPSNRYMTALGGGPTSTSGGGGLFGTAKQALAQPAQNAAANYSPAGYGAIQPNHLNTYTNYGSSNDRMKSAALQSGSQADTAAQNEAQSRDTFTGLLNQDPSKVLSAYVAGAMPQFMQQLQGVRENDISRGISTGDLGTAYEGSLASAFQRNIASQAAGLYGTQLGAAQGLYGQDIGNQLGLSNQYLSLLGGIQNQHNQQEAQKQAGLGQWLNTIGQLGGAALMGIGG